MKTRILVQVGVYNEKWADALKLLAEENQPEKLLTEVLNKELNWKLLKIWRMGDGTPHLIEFEGNLIEP